ncbi:MAG: DUF1223 domain-containing protein [Methylophilaceae bacterium]|nr:DUF1223 domain-containing protein [Methyloradius sp.]
MSLPRLLAVYLSIVTMLTTPYINAACVAQSGKEHVPLLELYTSEGCSSCPPAEQWLSSINSAGYSLDKVVPLAFHVDYWDYIGWKDRFAKAEYSARQNEVASMGNSRFVYTPQVVFNGSDFRGWQQNSRFNQSINDQLKQPARANLSLNIEPNASGDLSLKVSAQTLQANDSKNADVFIAIYENKLSSQVNAGENSGQKLDHDYVVREFYGPFKLDGNDANNVGWQRTITLKSDWKTRNAGVATFVQDRTNGAVLQALALKMCS